MNNENKSLITLYHMGSRGVGIVLVIGVLAQLLQRYRQPFPGFVTGNFWSTSMLLVVWILPVVSVWTYGLGRLLDRGTDAAGWMSVGIGAFLTVVWIFA